jgi:hypothetical protein
MKAACNAFGRRCGRSKSIGCTKGDGSRLKGETSHKMIKSLGFYGSIGPTWAIMGPHLWPKGWRDRGTSPVETEFGIRCHRIPLGSAVLGLGYYWILLIDLTPKFSASPNPKTLIGETWRHIKIQQFGSAHFGTCFHHPVVGEEGCEMNLRLCQALDLLKSSRCSMRAEQKWSKMSSNIHLDRCGEVMGIGDHHGHFEWVDYQFEEITMETSYWIGESTTNWWLSIKPSAVPWFQGDRDNLFFKIFGTAGILDSTNSVWICLNSLTDWVQSRKVLNWMFQTDTPQILKRLPDTFNSRLNLRLLTSAVTRAGVQRQERQ